MRSKDAHFHIIDYRYPVVTNQGYAPPEFNVMDYMERLKSMNVIGGTNCLRLFSAI
jgi:hypothetical protein